jgi:hypothetical protein
MAWYVYVAHFFGGAFLASAVPHFVNGISGRPFPSPFAKPPGQGESSPVVNVGWGAFNAGVAYLLVLQTVTFDVGSRRDVLTVGLGGALMALMLAKNFGRVYGGQKDR